MTVYVHFAMATGKAPLKLFNVAAVHDHGNSTIVLVNAFGGEPTTCMQVHHVAIEPERSDER